MFYFSLKLSSRRFTFINLGSFVLGFIVMYCSKNNLDVVK